MTQCYNNLMTTRRCIQRSIRRSSKQYNRVFTTLSNHERSDQSNTSTNTSSADQSSVPTANQSTIALVGLGNPGAIFDGTRHNVGFDFIDRFAKLHNITINQSSNQSLIGQGLIDGRNVMLVKPQTFMNLSGRAVASVMHSMDQSNKTSNDSPLRQLIDKLTNQPIKQPINPANIVVLFDDLSLPMGTVRLKIGGSSGGHNGVESIIQSTGSKSFVRIRIGIANEDYDMNNQSFNQTKPEFVLGKFSTHDQRSLNQSSWPRVAEALKWIVGGSVDRAMNAVNGKARFT